MLLHNAEDHERVILADANVRRWLDQFEDNDRPSVAKLTALIQLVSGDRLRRDLVRLLEERICADPTPVALYNESERRKWKGIPNRLFEETVRANPKRKGKKIWRVTGKVGPALVPRQRFVDERVGSEGVIANMLTQFAKQHARSVFLSPGPDTIRQRRVRRFVLVTDFIGSGTRAVTFLNAAWRLGSVRSWWSRRATSGMRFEVVAFSGTEGGIRAVQSHPSRPLVSVVTRCPTIEQAFLPAQARAVIDVCKRYAPTATDPLGFGGTGVLLAFDHGMPNNAPTIFWEKSRRWRPLFPGRTTIGSASPFNVVASEGDERKRLEVAARESVMGRPLGATSIEMVVLSALRRSPRHADAVSGRLGLDLTRVSEAFDQLRAWGWIDTHQQLTERGRYMVSRLAEVEVRKPLPPVENLHYFPESLRVPRDV